MFLSLFLGILMVLLLFRLWGEEKKRVPKGIPQAKSESDDLFAKYSSLEAYTDMLVDRASAMRWEGESTRHAVARLIQSDPEVRNHMLSVGENPDLMVENLLRADFDVRMERRFSEP